METLAQENAVLSQNQPILPEQPKQNNFLVILLSVLLFLSVSIAGFFAYQTQMLVKELTSMKATSTPISTEEPKDDPMADWKTYTNEKFSFKYPGTSSITGSGNNQTLLIGGLKVNINLQGPHQWGEGMSKSEIDKMYIKSFQYPDKPEIGMYPDSAVIFSVEFASISEKLSYQKQTDILDQTLSTFKFVESGMTSDWKTYINEKFTFKYPIDVVISSKTRGKEEIFEIKGLDKDIVLVVDPIEEHNFFLGKKVSKQIKYNNVSWNLLTGNEQYCDGGECSKISDALQVEYQNKRYTIVLGDLSYSNLEFDQILSTFKFVD